MSSVVVRKAELKDAEAILKIYSYYVENTAITFECEVPSLNEFRERIQKTLMKYPYFVLESDGMILGYAYAGAFGKRAAYDWSAEVTVYLDRNQHKRGYGRKLYEALEQALKEMGIRNLYACVAYPNAEDKHLTMNSVLFHEHLGYRRVGTFQNCGYKFDSWYSMVWMEKIIGGHDSNPSPIRCPL